MKVNPLYMIYLTRKKCLFYFLIGLFHKRAKKGQPPPGKKILVSNLGALGDLFYTLQFIEGLKRDFPDAEIGVLVAPRSRSALSLSAHITHVHEIEHWLKPASFLKKLGRFFYFHLKEKWRCAKEVEEIGYDWAINLCFVFCDVQWVFLKAGIAHRIGFDYLGYRKLLTHTTCWRSNTFILENFSALLKNIGGHRCLPWTKHFEKLEFLPADYTIFHMCSSEEAYNLPSEFWKKLYALFKQEGRSVFFTGKGEAQKRLIDEVAREEGENLCDQLNFHELCSVIQYAGSVITVDTLVGHLASAFSRPTTILYRSTRDIALWHPEKEATWGFAEETLRSETKSLARLIWVKEFNPDQVFEKVRHEIYC